MEKNNINIDTFHVYWLIFMYINAMVFLANYYNRGGGINAALATRETRTRLCMVIINNHILDS